MSLEDNLELPTRRYSIQLTGGEAYRLRSICLEEGSAKVYLWPADKPWLVNLEVLTGWPERLNASIARFNRAGGLQIKLEENPHDA